MWSQPELTKHAYIQNSNTTYNKQCATWHLPAIWFVIRYIRRRLELTRVLTTESILAVRTLGGVSALKIGLEGYYTEPSLRLSEVDELKSSHLGGRPIVDVCLSNVDSILTVDEEGYLYGTQYAEGRSHM